MSRLYDHIDLRVPNLAEAAPFYETLLPALGFSRKVEVEDWLQYEAGAAAGDIGAFFGVTESPAHVDNENRIAFWANDVDEVNRLALLAVTAGARNVEGPMLYEPGYHVVFLEDPFGNRLEICYRWSSANLAHSGNDR